jgi:hypothetical protein
MIERTPTMDRLFALRDLGIAEPLPDDVGDLRVPVTLQREIDQASRPGRNPRRWISRRVRRAALLPAALLLTTAAAAAATGVATVVLNPFQIAHDNATDTPTRLFEHDPGVTGATPAALWHQTVITSTIRDIETFTVPGFGPIQYWVADTEQHGICTALRLPNGGWAGLQHNGQVGGVVPGCRPTRHQLSGGALMLDSFDYAEFAVVPGDGQRWMIEYGIVSAPHPAARVRDMASGVSVPVIDGR